MEEYKIEKDLETGNAMIKSAILLFALASTLIFFIALETLTSDESLKSVLKSVFGTAMTFAFLNCLAFEVIAAVREHKELRNLKRELENN